MNAEHRAREVAAEKLVRTGKAKRGDALGAERPPLGVHIRVGVLRR